MNVANVDVLLPGRALTTSEGSLGFCGTYLVTSRGRHPRRIIFDPGHAGRRSALLRQIASHGLEPKDIDTVVLSHAHWDHAQNVDLFDHSKIWIHDAELYRGPGDGPRDIATPAWTTAMLGSVEVATAEEGRLVGEGVRVLHLPGHTAGSIGLVVETESGTAVLSGDAVSRRDIAQQGRCAVVHFDAAAALRSTKAVLDVADQVWPGHDQPFRVTGGRVGEYLSPLVDVEIVDHAIGH